MENCKDRANRIHLSTIPSQSTQTALTQVLCILSGGPGEICGKQWLLKKFPCQTNTDSAPLVWKGSKGVGESLIFTWQEQVEGISRIHHISRFAYWKILTGIQPRREGGTTNNPLWSNLFRLQKKKMITPPYKENKKTRLGDGKEAILFLPARKKCWLFYCFVILCIYFIVFFITIFSYTFIPYSFLLFSILLFLSFFLFPSLYFYYIVTNL